MRNKVLFLVPASVAWLCSMPWHLPAAWELHQVLLAVLPGGPTRALLAFGAAGLAVAWDIMLALGALTVLGVALSSPRAAA